MFDSIIILLDFGHDFIVGGKEVVFVEILESFDDNGVAFAVLGKHNVFLAVVGVDVTVAHIIGVYFSDGFDDDVNFFGFDGVEGDRDVIEWWQ